MPYGRRYRRTSSRFAPRRSFKRKRTFTRRKSFKRRRIGNGKTVFRQRIVLDCICDGTGALRVHGSTVDPVSFGAAINAGAMVNSLPEGVNIAALYDAYRVASIAFKWIPALPNIDTANETVNPLYFITDPDVLTTQTYTQSDVLQFHNMKTFNWNRPWKHYFKIPRVSFAGAAGSTVTKDGYFDWLVPPLYGVWNLQMFTISAGLVNNRIGQMIMITYLTVKNRR